MGTTVWIIDTAHPWRLIASGAEAETYNAKTGAFVRYSHGGEESRFRVGLSAFFSAEDAYAEQRRRCEGIRASSFLQRNAYGTWTNARAFLQWRKP